MHLGIPHTAFGIVGIQLIEGDAESALVCRASRFRAVRCVANPRHGPAMSAARVDDLLRPTPNPGARHHGTCLGSTQGDAE